MRRNTSRTLRPKTRSLLDTETVLLVNDGKAEIAEDNRVLDQGVSTYYYTDRAIGQSAQDRPSGRLCRRTDQKLTTYSCRSKILGYVGIVLLGKHFGRCHYAGLVTVPDRDQGRKHGHHSLTGSDISLKEPVHLMSAHHIRADLLYHSFLRPGKLVRKCIIASVERCPNLRHRNPDSGTAADIFLLQKRKLQQEQFLPFKTVAGLFKSRLVRREMHIADGIFQRHKGLLSENIFRKGLLDIGYGHIDRLGHQPVHNLSCHASALQPVRGVIDPGQGSREVDRTSGRRIVDLRMDHIQFAVEYARFAEKQENRSRFQTVISVLDSLEEHHLHRSALILHEDAETLSAYLRRDDFRKDLDVCAAGLNLRDQLDGTAVDVAERECAQKVSDCGHPKLRPKQRGPFRPHSRQELHICLQFVSHRSCGP